MRLSYSVRLMVCALALSTAHCKDDDDGGGGGDGSADGDGADGSGDGDADGSGDGDADGSGGDGDADGSGGGDGDADGSPNEQPAPTNSGIAPTTQLGDLTDAQARTLCEFQRDVYKSHLDSEDALCLGLYVLEADSCEEELTECRDTDFYQAELADDWACDEVVADDYLDGQNPCEASVAELEACVLADNASYWAHFEQASCAEPESLVPPDYAAECAPVLDKCPDLAI